MTALIKKRLPSLSDLGVSNVGSSGTSVRSTRITASATRRTFPRRDSVPAISGTQVCIQKSGQDVTPKTSCCWLLILDRVQVLDGSMALFAPHTYFESLEHPGMQHVCTLTFGTLSSSRKAGFCWRLHVTRTCAEVHGRNQTREGVGYRKCP